MVQSNRHSASHSAVRILRDSRIGISDCSKVTHQFVGRFIQGLDRDQIMTASRLLRVELTAQFSWKDSRAVQLLNSVGKNVKCDLTMQGDVISLSV